MQDIDPKALQIYFEMAWPLITGGFLALLILMIGWMVSKSAHKAVIRGCDRAKVDVALARFLGAMARYTVLAAAVIAALGRVGVETTSLVAIFASAGLAVGLALQGSLGNFASGVMILFFRPFELDDVVSIGGSTGKVVDIGLFATSLHTPDNMKIIVPNAAITGGTITNITTLGTRRAAVDVGVAYGEDVERIRALLLGCASVDGVLADPAPAVVFVDMGASSINFTVRVWCASADYFDVLDRVRSTVYASLNAEGIDIPYNQIVVHNAAA